MTNFTWIDGSIVGMYLLATMIAGIMVRKYVSRVDHFLVAGREMNVYLGIASLAATEFGIVTCMYTAQAGYTRGFAGSIPGILNAVAMFVIGWTGFCVKPLRDSGAMTIPELFEKRFGKFVRWLAGVVIVLGGLLNMGVFLRVGGQFLVVCCGLNLQYLEIAMTVLLLGVAVYTIMGGMLSVLVTDFLQFIVMSVGLLVVSFLVLSYVGWDRMVDTVETHYGEGGFNPFVAKDLGWAFVLSNLFTNTASVLTWQTCIARLLAAKDSKTGRKVYTGTAFFFVCRWIIPGLWGIAALAMIEPAVVETIGLQFGEKDGIAVRHAVLPRPDRACRDDGRAGGGHAGGGHVHGFVLHADLGQRDLQRHSGAVPPHAVVRKEGHPLEPVHRGLDRHVPAVLGPVVQAGGQSLGVPADDRLDLSGQHVVVADRLLLLETRQQLGSHRRHRRRCGDPRAGVVAEPVRPGARAGRDGSAGLERRQVGHRGLGEALRRRQLREYRHVPGRGRGHGRGVVAQAARAN